jgi:hypothetical protein
VSREQRRMRAMLPEQADRAGPSRRVKTTGDVRAVSHVYA